MRAGLLRHRVTIQSDTGTTTDATGGITASWGTFCVLQVELLGAETRETEALRRRYAEATYDMKGRYRSGITPKMRAVLGSVDSSGNPLGSSRTFEILGAVDLDGRSRELHLAVKEMDLG